MPWLAWMRSYLTVISVLPCLCLRVAMTVIIVTVLCFRGMVPRSQDFGWGAELCFLVIVYNSLVIFNHQTWGLGLLSEHYNIITDSGIKCQAIITMFVARALVCPCSLRTFY